MYPNPQDALPLPPHPDLHQYRKLAKELVKACKSGHPAAIAEWASTWVGSLARMPGMNVTADLREFIVRRGEDVEGLARRKLVESAPSASNCSLAAAQFVLARAHGFVSWPKFVRHIEGIVAASTPVSTFELAVDAIIAGNAGSLERLLRGNPQLPRARSTREHRATLLHYVSANGVETFRQRTPANAPEIAKILLDAGAAVDAVADVYGGGATTLGLVATSFPPFRAGVQNTLMQILLDHGAAIDGPIAGNGQSVIAGALANGRPEAAEYLATQRARLDLDTAAGLGNLDVVRTFVEEDRSVKEGATEVQLARGFLWACAYGRNAVVEFLLDKGVDIATVDSGGQSGLHWAVMGGHLSTIHVLMKRKAPLEIKNVYGGTVLGQAVWSAAHGGDPAIYVPVLEALITSGAKLMERHPPINKRIDDLLQRHGSLSDATLFWYGENGERAGESEQRAGENESATRDAAKGEQE
jgi:hypothetical protein